MAFDISFGASPSFDSSYKVLAKESKFIKEVIPKELHFISNFKNMLRPLE